MSTNSITAYRVLYYLKHHGVVQGSRRLFRIFRQLHELRLGEFKGTDWRGNEFYFDPLAQWPRQRFVLYKDRKDFDATDVTPDWHWWLHQTGDETPQEVNESANVGREHNVGCFAAHPDCMGCCVVSAVAVRLCQRPFQYHPWSLLPPRNRLSKYGFLPNDIAPPGYLPRILHEAPFLSLEEERRRALWKKEAEAVLMRLWSEKLRGIEPSPVELALLSGDDGRPWVRRHRALGVHELYGVWKKEQQPLPWQVPVNVRMAPAPEGEWGRRRYEEGGYLRMVQEREKKVEETLKKLYRRV